MPAYGQAYGPAELKSIITKEMTTCSFTCVGIQ